MILVIQNKIFSISYQNILLYYNMKTNNVADNHTPKIQPVSFDVVQFFENVNILFNFRFNISSATFALRRLNI